MSKKDIAHTILLLTEGLVYALPFLYGPQQYLIINLFYSISSQSSRLVNRRFHRVIFYTIGFLLSISLNQQLLPVIGVTLAIIIGAKATKSLTYTDVFTVIALELSPIFGFALYYYFLHNMGLVTFIIVTLFRLLSIDNEQDDIIALHDIPFNQVSLRKATLNAIFIIQFTIVLVTSFPIYLSYFKLVQLEQFKLIFIMIMISKIFCLMWQKKQNPFLAPAIVILTFPIYFIYPFGYYLLQIIAFDAIKSFIDKVDDYKIQNILKTTQALGAFSILALEEQPEEEDFYLTDDQIARLQEILPLFGLRKAESIEIIDDEKPEEVPTISAPKQVSIMEEWDKYMTNFEPEDILSFEVEAGGSEILFETIHKATTIRGAFFVTLHQKDFKIDFLIKGPSGTILLSKERLAESIFNVTVPTPGEYKFIFQNKRSKDSTPVTFALDVHDSVREHLRLADLDNVSYRIENIHTAMKDNYFEAKIGAMRQEQGDQFIQQANQKLLIFSLFEIIGIIIITGWQVYYLKKILGTERII